MAAGAPPQRCCTSIHCLIYIALVLCLVGGASVGLYFGLNWPWWAGFLIGANLAGFLLVPFDKLSAKSCDGARVPELALWTTALLTGWPAVWLSMWACHHKVSKPDFKTPLIVVTVLSALAMAGYAAWELTRDR